MKELLEAPEKNGTLGKAGLKWGRAGWRVLLPCGTRGGWPSAGIRGDKLPSLALLSWGARAVVLAAA